MHAEQVTARQAVFLLRSNIKSPHY